MTAPATFALYAGLNALLLLALSYNVGSRRGKQGQLQPGDIGDAALVRAIRAHANFAEHAPLALLVLLALAWLDSPRWALHLYGASFTAGRVLQALGMMREKHPNALRFVGNATTGLALLGGGMAAIVIALSA